MRAFSTAGLFLATMLAAGTAGAASYNFDVLYSADGGAVLAAGSDEMLGTILNQGDSFTYTLTANDGGRWTSLGDNSVFPLIALALSDNVFTRNDVNVFLKFGGTTVYAFSASGVATCCAHLGANSGDLTDGLTWDQWVLEDTIVEASGGAPIASLLPYPPSAEHIGYAVVPEPASWALLIAGFGGAGAVLRQRKALAAV